jgi:ATP-dependent RNA helicase RhlE
VHRIGRTGRAGAGGEATSLVSADENGLLRDIERVLRRTIPVAPTPQFNIVEAANVRPPPREIDPRSPQARQGHGGQSHHRRPDNRGRGAQGQTRRFGR